MPQPYGSQSMVDTLRRVVVRRPDEAFGSADPVTWHYAGRPDLDIARQEHDAFVAVLIQAGAEVLYQDEPSANLADAIFVHDTGRLSPLPEAIHPANGQGPCAAARRQPWRAAFPGLASRSCTPSTARQQRRRRPAVGSITIPRRSARVFAPTPRAGPAVRHWQA